MKDVFLRNFTYNDDTGILYWSVNANSRARIGYEAGCVRSNGYKQVMLNYKSYLVHRIIATMYLGLDFSDKRQYVDHINGVKTDNRLINLRICSNRGNMQNCYTHRESIRVLGAHPTDSNKWVSYIRHGKGLIYLGIFLTQSDAHDAYIKAEQEIEKFGKVITRKIVRPRRSK